MICFDKVRAVFRAIAKHLVMPCMLCTLASSVSAQQSAEYVAESTDENKVIAASGQQYNPLSGFKSSRLAETPPAPAAVGAKSDGGFAMESIGYTNQATVVDPTKPRAEPSEFAIYHQPLIQIRMRIAEVVRQDNFTAKTVLDQVRQRATETTIAAHRAGERGSVGSTRFPTPTTLFGENNTYNGGLFNLTTREMNLLGQILATEFSADLLTCPQVVTLNGQRVELLSGVNAPFNLGQSVLQDGTLSVQETFYKHIGTYLTVTPRIVNWGPHGEGQGEAPIRWQHVKSWNALAAMMTMEQLFVDTTLVETVKPYVGNTLLMPTSIQSQMLNQLNQRSKREILELLASRGADYRYPAHLLFHPLDCEPLAENGCPCYWTPSDCTLDLSLILRQSQQGITSVSDASRATPSSRPAVAENSEQVGAAVASVVQIKSGHGAVLAGLIGMRDNELTSKVPILGDVPLLGALFRSRTTSRQKTEIIVFLEAEVLPSEANSVLAESSRDFLLSRPYINHDVLANPLEASIQRVGIGSYLPPRSLDEKLYWERIGRKVQRSCAATSDLLR